MINYPKLSIVVPTYNRAKYLQECIDSIILQNYPNLEIIITDDNSTDDTKKIANKYINRYKFIKYVKNTRYPKGPNGNKNNGLDYVTGEIIGIFDDDDTLIDGSLNLLVEKLLEGYDIVIGNCIRSDNGKFTGRGLNHSCEVPKNKFLCGEADGEFWGIFTKELLGTKRFDIDLLGGESTLWRSMQLEAKTYYIHKAVRNYRINSNGITKNSFNNSHKIVINYERDIEYYGDKMKALCPCYLATIYKGAAYFAKLSSNYKKTYRYIYKSLTLCPKYKMAYIMLFLSIFPKTLIIKLTQLKEKYRND